MTNNKNPVPKLDGVKTEFEADSGGLILKKSQEIPQSLLDSIKAKRDDSTNHREGDFMHVASIPAVIAEKWMKEGFNILDPNVNGKEIVRRLKAENLDGFLTTDKRI